MRRLVVPCAIVLMGLAMAPASVAAITYTVNGSTGSDVGCALDPATKCKTIKAATDQAVAGDTVIVESGTYTESVTLANGVSLLGVSAVSVRIIPPTDSRGIDATNPPLISGVTVAAEPGQGSAPLDGRKLRITGSGTVED